MFLKTKFFLGHLGPSNYPRAVRQFGRILEKQTQNVNSGIGPFLESPSNPDVVVIEPTKTFDKKLSVSIAGIVLYSTKWQKHLQSNYINKFKNETLYTLKVYR